MANLEKLTPPKELSLEDRSAVFEHLYRHLAAHRNAAELYATAEHNESSRVADKRDPVQEEFEHEIQQWGQDLLHKIWVACEEPRGKECPELDPHADTSVAHLHPLPPRQDVSKLLNTVVFLHITTSKHYSAHTRVFLAEFGDMDEHAITATLKNPDRALKEAEKQTQRVKEEQAEQGKTLRRLGMGGAAVAGGVLIGVTGGLAAPLVGAGVTTVLAWLGVGGSAAGLLASGLAGSSAVCGTLFGAYGAKRAATHVGRHTREIRDFDVIPVQPSKDTLAIRLCVSGWLSTPDDVTAPWTIFDDKEDTFALQWEVEALEKLSSALGDLVKANALKYVKKEIIKRTVLASLMSSLAPIAWLKLGQIIDNPWMNARALALKAGHVLGTLIAQRAFGTRPVTLTGYSLGALVILTALTHLASLPPSSSATVHIVQDVFLFGTPAPRDARTWTAARRVVAGRLVNGYAEDDYILAVLARVSDATLEVAGLGAVRVKGVENVRCEGVEGHLKWRGMVGRCLEQCGARGVVSERVSAQVREIAVPIQEEMDAGLDGGDDDEEFKA